MVNGLPRSIAQYRLSAASAPPTVAIPTATALKSQPVSIASASAADEFARLWTSENVMGAGKEM
jgi:hypothetical protein